MNVKSLLLGLAALGLGVCAVIFFATSSSPAKVGDESEEKPPQAPIADAQTQAVARVEKPQEPSLEPVVAGKTLADAVDSIAPIPVTADNFEEFAPTDRKIAVALQRALDDNDLEGVRKAAALAVKSSDPALRMRALEALDFFGAKALPEMAGMIADPSEEVSSRALETSAKALGEIEDKALQFESAASYMTLLSKNQAVLDSFSTLLSSSANDLCTPEDEDNPVHVKRAAENREKVVWELAEMIGKGGALSEATKEAYSFVTGHDWIDAEEARRWAKDPENYEPPETNDDEGEVEQ